MTSANEDLIGKFFQAYGRGDLDAIRLVMDENIRWTFPGAHPLGGIKSGVEEVVAFFDKMGAIIGASKARSEKLVGSANEEYVIECQHISTDREDGANLDQQMCVLWRFDGGKIVEGRHFAADQQALDEFFSRVSTDDQG